MKIFYDYKIFFNQSIGGPSRYFVELIKELINLKKNIKVICPLYINKYLQEINSRNKIFGRNSLKFTEICRGS